MWNIVRSAPGQQLLAEWHARADQLTLDQPLRAGLVFRWLGRGLARLPEARNATGDWSRSPGRRAKARRRAQRAAGLPVVRPPCVRPVAGRRGATDASSPAFVEPLEAPTPPQVAQALRTIEAMPSATSRSGARERIAWSCVDDAPTAHSIRSTIVPPSEQCGRPIR